MKITLYKTKSPITQIGKELTDALDLDFKFKQSSSILNPTIEIGNRDDNISGFNYAYIDAFDRYYVIRNITVQPHNYYTIELDCDVLESWKQDILNSKAWIAKQVIYNPYYESNYESEVRTETTTYDSTQSIADYSGAYILVTIGGVR